jgi:hypothetical protein
MIVVQPGGTGEIRLAIGAVARISRQLVTTTSRHPHSGACKICHKPTDTHTHQRKRVQ